MRKNPDIPLGTEDAVWIGGSVYCLTIASLHPVIRALSERGYWISDQRKDEYLRERYTHDELEQAIRPLWMAQRPEVHFVKCLSCGQYQTERFVREHGRTCDHCSAVLYLEVYNETEVTLRFRAEPERYPHRIRMLASHVDAAGGYLYLQPEFIYNGGSITCTPEEAQAWFDDHPEAWEKVEHNGAQLYKIRFTGKLHSGESSPDDPVEVSEFRGHYRNYRDIKLVDGVEYAANDEINLPLPSWTEIYEAWRWAPRPSDPELYGDVLRAGNVAMRLDYYDHETVLTPEKLAEMGRYIRLLTALDADRWDEISPSFPTKGNEAVKAVATFCHPNPMYRP